MNSCIVCSQVWEFEMPCHSRNRWFSSDPLPRCSWISGHENEQDENWQVRLNDMFDARNVHLISIYMIIYFSTLRETNECVSKIGETCWQITNCGWISGSLSTLGNALQESNSNSRVIDWLQRMSVGIVLSSQSFAVLPHDSSVTIESAHCHIESFLLTGSITLHYSVLRFTIHRPWHS